MSGDLSQMLQGEFGTPRRGCRRLSVRAVARAIGGRARWNVLRHDRLHGRERHSFSDASSQNSAHMLVREQLDETRASTAVMRDMRCV